MDIFWYCMWLLWVTSIWATIKWSASQAAQKVGLFWIINKSKDLAPQMANHNIYAYSGWFWCVICGQKIRRAPGFSPQKYHEISEEWEGQNISGINQIWYYTKKHSDITCRLSMKSYIVKLLLKVVNQALVKISFPRIIVGRSCIAERFNMHQKSIHLLP